MFCCYFVNISFNEYIYSRKYAAAVENGVAGDFEEDSHMVFGKTTGKKRTDIDNVKRILNSESDFYTVETYKSDYVKIGQKIFTNPGNP